MPDQRDHLYAAPVAGLAALPTTVDLRNQCPPVYEQGQLGSCTANGIGGAMQFERMKQKLTPDFIPSRLFVYYNERVIEHTVNSDSGAMIRDGIKSVNKQGACSESICPYYAGELTIRPTSTCYAAALNNQSTSYHRVTRGRSQLKNC